jgi:hypothetical protein
MIFLRLLRWNAYNPGCLAAARAFTCSGFVRGRGLGSVRKFSAGKPVTGIIEKFTNFLANWRDAIVGPE